MVLILNPSYPILHVLTTYITNIPSTRTVSACWYRWYCDTNQMCFADASYLWNIRICIYAPLCHSVYDPITVRTEYMMNPYIRQQYVRDALHWTRLYGRNWCIAILTPSKWFCIPHLSKAPHLSINIYATYGSYTS